MSSEAKMEPAPDAATKGASAGTAKKVWPIQKPGIRGQKAWPKYVVELMKFSVYLSIPVLLMYGFGSQSPLLGQVIRNREYIVYPPEGPRPPPAEVYHAIAKKRREIREAAEREAAAAAASSSSPAPSL